MKISPDQLEKRAFGGLQVRAVDGKVVGLRGYAAVFDKPSLDLGGFIEIVRRGAFSRTLKENREVLAFAYHDYSKPLARRSAGTLTLSEDGTGLLADITLAETTLARDVAADVQARNLEGMSFGFYTRKDTWTRGAAGQPDTRELIDVDLFEVSVVTLPAYPDTSVALRSRPAAVRADVAAAASRLNTLHLRLLSV